MIDANDDQIVLQFYETIDNGGSDITKYELYMNDGNDFNEPTSLVSGYSNNITCSTCYSMSYIIDRIALTLTTGKIYKFKFRAINEKGYSEDSDVVWFALVNMAAAPLTISKDK